MSVRTPTTVQLDSPWQCPRCKGLHYTMRVAGAVPLPVGRSVGMGLILDCVRCPDQAREGTASAAKEES